MYIVYEYAISVLAVLIGATMLFTVYVMSLVLIEGGRILVQMVRKLRVGPLSAAGQTDSG